MGQHGSVRDDQRRRPDTQAVVLDIAKSAEVARLGPHRGLNQCPISPDGRWVATATWKGKDVKVWEVATGRLAWQLPCDSAFVRFSPDGRWLAVAKFPGLECRLWHVGSWHPGPTIQVSKGFLTMAFSRDGRLLAIDDAGRVRLVDTDTGREVATLDAGTGSSANFFCMAFSPDGTYLAAGRDHIIHLWDLRRIREQLAALGLDWDGAPVPASRPAPDPGPGGACQLAGQAATVRQEVGLMSTDHSSDERDPVERLAEEFVARHRRGERPSPAEYAERHPQWAERIHALFPALLLMEQHKPGRERPE